MNSIDWKNDNALEEFDDLLTKSYSNLSIEENIYFHENALNKASELSNYKFAFEYAKKLSHLFLIKPNIDQSIHFGNIALSFARKMNKPSLIGRSLSNIGSFYIDKKKYFIAIDYLTQANKYALEVGDSKLEEFVLGNISTCYIQLGLFEDAIVLVNRNIKLLDKNTTEYKSYLLSINLRALLFCYTEMEQADSTALYAKKLEQHLPVLERDKINYENSTMFESEQGDVLADLANYYIQNNQHKVAEKYFAKLKTLPFAYPSSLYLLSLNIAIQKEEYNKVETLLKNPNIEITDKEDTYNKYAFEYYSKIGAYEKAIEYLKKQKDAEIKNLQLNLSSIKKYSETKRDNIEKEQQIMAYEQEELIQRNRDWLYLVISIFTVLLTSILLYLYTIIKKRNATLIVELKNKEIIAEQRNKLQKNDAQKVKLFVNIAHELRTPISIIKGLINKVDRQNGKSGQEICNIIYNNSLQLSEQIDQILAVSQMERFSPEIHKNTFYLNQLVQKVMDDLKPKANHKNIQLVLDMTEEQFLVESDIDKLTIIIKNLLTNAIKYSNNNSIVTINFNVKEDDFCEIQVKDSGRGISDEDVPHVFDRFYQSNNTEPEGGFGVGLALSKEYIELLGGKIAVKSTLGIGSLFSFTLPKLPLRELTEEMEIVNIGSNQETSQDTITPILSKDSEKKDLLIVEDNPDFFVYLKTILSPHFNLKHVYNGEQAKDFLINNSIDLIITDWMMPNMNGLELVHYLKQEESYRSIPIIMLTARSIITDQIKALKAGANAYLTKPAEEDLLISKTTYLLQSSQNHSTNTFLDNYLTTEQGGVEINAEDQVWILKVEEIIRNQIHDFNLNLNYLAQFMDMSLYGFNKKIKEVTGTTPKKFIQALRLWEARKLLEEKEISSVKIVSLTVGFKDTKNFSRNFKDKFGKYPSDYL